MFPSFEGDFEKHRSFFTKLECLVYTKDKSFEDLVFKHAQRKQLSFGEFIPRIFLYLQYWYIFVIAYKCC